MDWPEVKRELATELRRDSTWTLDRMLEDRPATATYRQSAAAALLELVHQRGGMPALKIALDPPRRHGEPDLVEGAHQGPQHASIGRSKLFGERACLTPDRL